jgi:multiple sugar transport system ATP-binding protein
VFVAAFIGSPAMNLYEATMAEGARSVKVGSQTLPVPDNVHAARPGLIRYGGKKLVLGVRPEHLPAAHDGVVGPRLIGNVDLVEALGSELVVHFTIDAKRVQPEGATSDDEDATARAGEGVARVSPETKVKVGDKITFVVNTEGMQFFDIDTDKAIWN